MSNILQEELNYQKWNFTTTCTGMKITMKIKLLQKNSLNFNYHYIYELFLFHRMGVHDFETCSGQIQHLLCLQAIKNQQKDPLFRH